MALHVQNGYRAGEKGEGNKKQTMGIFEKKIKGRREAETVLLDGRFSRKQKKKSFLWVEREGKVKKNSKKKQPPCIMEYGVSPLPTSTPFIPLAQICSLHLVGSLQSMKKVTQPRPSAAFHHAD